MTLDADAFSLYVHIPYCISKCPYCDFNSHVVPQIPEGEYTNALLQELDYHSYSEEWASRGLKSLFFGGGTPSTFNPKSISRILDRAALFFSFTKEIEITLEANPGTVDAGNFSGYRSAGVNRISLGVQSFHPQLLKTLGRTHTAAETREALDTVQRVGFENFNLDLIYAVPGETLENLKSDLEEVLRYSPPHVSAYNLTIEEGTPFYRENQLGRLRLLPEETEISMAELVEQTLTEKHRERYEISNYALPGYRSRHNTNYWQAGDYLGIGAGAHSYLRSRENGFFGRRWHNEKNPGTYMEGVLRRGQAIAGEENSDLRKAAGEFLFLGLRMIEGFSCKTFISHFGQHPEELYPRINDWVEQGLMDRRGERLRLSSRGLMVANSIFTELF